LIHHHRHSLAVTVAVGVGGDTSRAPDNELMPDTQPAGARPTRGAASTPKWNANKRSPRVRARRDRVASRCVHLAALRKSPIDGRDTRWDDRTTSRKGPF